MAKLVPRLILVLESPLKYTVPETLVVFTLFTGVGLKLIPAPPVLPELPVPVEPPPPELPLPPEPTLPSEPALEALPNEPVLTEPSSQIASGSVRVLTPEVMYVVPESVSVVCPLSCIVPVFPPLLELPPELEPPEPLPVLPTPLPAAWPIGACELPPVPEPVPLPTFLFSLEPKRLLEVVVDVRPPKNQNHKPKISAKTRMAAVTIYSILFLIIYCRENNSLQALPGSSLLKSIAFLLNICAIFMNTRLVSSASSW